MSGCPASPLVPVDHPPVGFESQVAIASGTVGPDMPTPVPANERVDLLDAIRGVALGGILLANLMSFFGADMLGAEGRRAMPFGMAGERVLFGINWLVEGKFYSVFSMLLGAGFALQAGLALTHLSTSLVQPAPRIASRPTTSSLITPRSKLWRRLGNKGGHSGYPRRC